MTDMSSVAVYPFGRTSSNAAAPSIPSAANSSAPVPHDMPVSISERQRYYWTARWQTDEAESLAEIAAGRVERFSSGAAAVAWLLSTDEDEA